MKVLNFGSLNIDMVYAVDHFVRAGETLSSDRLERFCGGKGLNQSVALARAGARGASRGLYRPGRRHAARPARRERRGHPFCPPAG